MNTAKKKAEARRWVDGGCFSTIRGRRRNVVVEDADGREVARVTDQDDAQLIVVAPELLEALKKLVRIASIPNVPPSSPGLISALAAASAAISKATP